MTAPADPGARGSTGASPTRSLLDRANVVDVPSQSRTIEMLLEMHGKNPGLAGGELPKVDPTDLPARPAGSEGRNRPPAAWGAGSNMLGDGLEAGSKARPDSPQSVGWSAQPAAVGGGFANHSAGGYRPAQAAGTAADDDVRWLIPRPILNFIRENRGLVLVGALVVLALVWGGAALGSARRD